MDKPGLPKRVAAELERTARRGFADDARRWMEKATRAREAGDAAEARRAAVRAKQSAPRAPVVREALGLAAFDLAEWHEAVQELLAFRRLSGARIHDATIAEAYRRLGKPDRALDVIAELTRADASDAVWIDAQIVRARAYRDRGMLDAARSALVRAAKDAAPASRARLAEVGAEIERAADA